MKKIIFVIFFIFSTLSISAQSWLVTFHPAEKHESLPNRYACIYEDPSYTVQLRSDLPYLKVIMSTPVLIDCNDTVVIELFTESGELKSMHNIPADMGEDKQCAVIRCWSGVNWLMTGGKIKIIFKKSNNSVIVLKINKMDRTRIIAQYYKYLDDIKM